MLIVMLITTTTAVMLARKPDIYMSETDVQVDTEGPASGLTSGKGNIIVDTGSDPTYFNTQLQIITKPGLLRRVVKTLDLEHNPDFLRTQANDTTWQRLLRTFGVKGAPSGRSGGIAKAEVTNSRWIRKLLRLRPPTIWKRPLAWNLLLSSLQAGLKVDPVKRSVCSTPKLA